MKPHPQIRKTINVLLSNTGCYVIKDAGINKNTVSALQKFSPLKIALIMAFSGLSPLTQAENHAPVIVNDGTTVAVNGTAEQHVMFQDTHTSLSVVNVNSIINGNYVDISTTGGETYHSISASKGGKINLDNSHITSASTTSAIFASDASTSVTLNNSEINAFSGLKAEYGANVSLFNSDVTVDNAAVSLSGNGSSLYAENTNFVSTNERGFLPTLDINGASQASLIGGSVTMMGLNGRMSDAIRLMGDSATSQASLLLDGTTVTVGSADNPVYGMAVDINMNATADIRNASLTTYGDTNNSSTIWLPDETDSVTVTHSQLETHGDAAIGIEVYDNGRARISDSTVKVYGDNTYGLYNNGSQSLMAATNVDILATGTSSTGAATFGGHLDIANSRILTEGQRGYGVYAKNANSFVTLDNSVVTTTGDNAYGVGIGNGASVEIDSSEITSSGAGSSSLRYFISSTDASANKGTLSNSVITAENASAIKVEGGSLDLAINNSRVSGSDGTLMKITDYSPTITAANTSISSDHSALLGDLVIESATGTANINLVNQSAWAGKTQSATSVSIDNTSTWEVTGDSIINGLDNAGIINFVNTNNNQTGLSSSEQAFSTLTIKGDYIGNNGTINFNTILGNDNSPTNKMIVTGNTSGDTAIHVNNIHGSGDLTTADGIELIDVGGKSDGNFTLSGRAVAGAYEYSLFQGGVNDPDNGNWYLRSEKKPDPEPTPDPDPTPDPEPTPDPDPTPDPGPTPDPDPTPEPDPTPAPAPEYRPEPGAYLGNRVIAESLFNHSYYERQGSTWSLAHGDERPLWLRTQAKEINGHAVQGEIAQTLDSSIVQLGRNIFNWVSNNHSLQLGVMAGYGSGRTKANADVNSHSSIGHVNGYDLGLYATWLEHGNAPGGAYVDSWVQYGWYNNDVSSDGLASENYDSRNLSSSLEAGYGFNIDNKLLLEPQVQVIVNRYSFEDHREHNGTLVRSNNNLGVQTRLGLRLSSLQSRIKPWLAFNWIYDAQDDVMQFDAVRVNEDTPRHRAEVKGGIQTEIGNGWQLWGQANAQFGDENYSEYGGLVGIKYQW
ncbi:autotransporter family protein [Atlantibacter hermannii]|uniref:autotransporter family protein n=1 Tax=Atlantibacter hermannii TaxID=565 RepID=UPI00289F7DBA|nr:autotransporter outer membrane beta-barrel domain-containing protein [Atlantibacter hermannii]